MDPSSDDRPPPLWTWAGAENPLEFDQEAHAEWCAKWAPPCPDGNPRQLRPALGFRERNTCELELRVPLGGDDLGVCSFVVDERHDEVYVRLLVCMDPDRAEAPRSSEYMNCPVRTWLDQPLGQRAVVDVDTGEPLPLYMPRYRDD